VSNSRRHRNRSHTSQRFDSPRRLLGSTVAVSKLALGIQAKRIHEAVDAQHKAVSHPRRYRAHPHALQRLDGPRRQLVFLVAVSKLTMATTAE